LKSKTKQQRKPIPIPSSTTPLTNDKQSELIKVEGRKDRDEEVDDDEVRLKEFFLRTLTQLDVGGGQGMTVQEIIQASQDKAGTILEDVSLPYESTPTIERRVRTDGGVVNEAEEQDGIVLVAHVVGGDDPKVNISSGFAVGGNEKEKKQGSMILTCCHTLNQVSPKPYRPRSFTDGGFGKWFRSKDIYRKLQQNFLQLLSFSLPRDTSLRFLPSYLPYLPLIYSYYDYLKLPSILHLQLHLALQLLHHLLSVHSLSTLILPLLRL
jgi:hypothetical protein